MATISERINKIIANQLGLVEKDIRPDSRFTEDLNADSLDMVEMTMAMEEEFSTPEHAISIPDEVAESIKTVQDAIDYIRNLGLPDKKFNAAGGTIDSSKTGNPAPVKKRSFINNIFRKKRSR